MLKTPVKIVWRCQLATHKDLIASFRILMIYRFHNLVFIFSITVSQEWQVSTLPIAKLHLECSAPSILSKTSVSLQLQFHVIIEHTGG